ncbi:MAG TPA: hypothetical protein PK095_04585, partial [Myxococcota bacterium]|nr:hypothetical protein [Myxococcota bacterium]
MQPGEVAPSAAWVRYSEGRLNAMTRALEAIEPGRGFEVADAARLLGSHVAGDEAVFGRLGASGTYTRATGDCLAQSISIQSVIVDPERQTIHVSTGDHPTSRGPWTPIRWTWGGAPSMTVVKSEVGPSDRPPRRTGSSWDSSGGAEALVPTSGGAPRVIAQDPTERAEAPRDGDLPRGDLAGAAAQGPYFSGDGGRAYRSFLCASRLEIRRAPAELVREAMEAAVGLDPADPSYRQLAGGLALRSGDLRAALEHFEAALEHEPSAFRRAELLSWDAKVSRWAGLIGRERDRRRALAATLPSSLVRAAL